VHISFRVDASSVIGLGHLKRCISLAKAVQNEGAQTSFILRDWGLDYNAFLRDACATFHLLPKIEKIQDARNYATWLGMSEIDDAALCAAHFADSAPHWVVVDHYGISAEWHDYMRRQTNAKIAVIDDIANRPLNADVIIDQNWDSDHEVKYRSVNFGSATILGGPLYAMLDPAFALASRYVQCEHVGSIGVFMGGSDVANITMVAVEAIRQSGFSGEVEVVASSANPNLSVLTKASREGRGFKLSVDLPNLAGFFSSHGLQIGAGGSATWERLCIGAPTIAIACADNQIEVLKQLDKLGLQIGVVDPFDRVAIATKIQALVSDFELRERLTLNGLALVDGKGAARAVAALMA
jgi:UDP-2,4-diacetamido-2,4,6-trideoxy-beta-L-altropyranose hydrolase